LNESHAYKQCYSYYSYPHLHGFRLRFSQSIANFDQATNLNVFVFSTVPERFEVITETQIKPKAVEIFSEDFAEKMSSIGLF
jgi:hypothetical protein